MKTAGTLSGTLVVEDGAPQRLDLRPEGLTLDDGARTFALAGLTGEWHWRAEQQAGDESDEAAARGDDAPRSILRWDGGALFGLDVGAAQLRFTTAGRQFRLLEAAHIPLLDGAIELESFRVRNAGRPSVAFMVDATIQPLSVQRLCRAFGRPEFGGRVGGAISKLRMREGVVTLGTTLRAQVFDGAVTLDLRLEQPFGKWPRFYSSIALENLDLVLVTSAFAFGRITGRLSGSIDAWLEWWWDVQPR